MTTAHPKLGYKGKQHPLPQGDRREESAANLGAIGSPRVVML